MVRVVNLKCSNCGDSLSEGQTVCDSCMQPVVIKHMSSLSGLTPQELSRRGRLMCREAEAGGEFSSDASFTAGCCFLRLKLYDQALQSFEKAFSEDLDNAEAYFYAAVAMLKGKRPFVMKLVDIRKAQEYVNAAAMIDDLPVFHLFLSYIKLDFYARKYLRVNPGWDEELDAALTAGLSQDDKTGLFELIGQPPPPELDE